MVSISLPIFGEEKMLRWGKQIFISISNIGSISDLFFPNFVFCLIASGV